MARQQEAPTRQSGGEGRLDSYSQKGKWRHCGHLWTCRGHSTSSRLSPEVPLHLAVPRKPSLSRCPAFVTLASPGPCFLQTQNSSLRGVLRSQGKVEGLKGPSSRSPSMGLANPTQPIQPQLLSTDWDQKPTRLSTTRGGRELSQPQPRAYEVNRKSTEDNGRVTIAHEVS